MNRDEAKQLDSQIQKILEKYSKRKDLDLSIGNMIMEQYLEIIPEDPKRTMIVLGKEATSYKLGNIRLDLKSVLIAIIEFVASFNSPETIFEYLQLAVISILCIGTITKRELDDNSAVIIYALHLLDAYEIGITVKQLKDKILEMLNDYQIKDFDMKMLDRNISDLLKWNVITIKEEKIYLNEVVWGKISEKY
ncbi:MAG: hypothetical protein NC240_01230 [Clostridium sp.]|nr:hypothetical protein [Clostridium sp.]